MIFRERETSIVKDWREKLSAEGPVTISLGTRDFGQNKVERGATLLLLDG